MLESVRHYARERLDTAGTADACRRRHAHHYAEFARQAWKGTRREDDLLWWSRMRTDIDNLRAAVLWALDSRVDGDGDLALRIIADLTGGSFEESTGVFSWAEQAAERAQRAGPGLRSSVLAAASMSAWYRADYTKAHRLARDALRDAIPPDSPCPELPSMALILNSRPQRLRGILADGLATLDAIGADPFSHTRLHSAAAGCAAQIGDLEFAAVEAQEALRIARQLRQRSCAMVGLYLVALTGWRTAPDEALAALEEAIAMGRRLSYSTNTRGRALALVAQLRAEKGDANGAISALRHAITETHRAGERSGVATAFDRGIQVLAATGHHELAAVLGGIVTEGVFANTHALPDHELPDRQRALERLEADLGADRYAASIARGATMTYDEALDSTVLALEELMTP
jgi:hypothetical protein